MWEDNSVGIEDAPTLALGGALIKGRMKPFTKLFSSITSSSIWRAPDHVRLVWITMLAMADKDGEIWASVGGLADLARVSRDDCASALAVLAGPDDDSRTKDHEGRRIDCIDGGWRLLNYKKYREMGKNEDRREYFAEYKRKKRSNADALSTDCPQSPHTPQMSTSPSASVSSSLSSLERESEGDIGQPSRSMPATDPWQLERLNPWAQALVDANCRIGSGSWRAWKALVLKHSLATVLTAAPEIEAVKRWSSEVEDVITRNAKKAGSSDNGASAERLRKKISAIHEHFERSGELPPYRDLPGLPAHAVLMRCTPDAIKKTLALASKQ